MEGELYRVLQRAKLTQYFENFLQQGGDDVQQLCEANEDEFLEIMALVGMSGKPLHVRRLQRTLQEYVSNPVLFRDPSFDISRPMPSCVASALKVLAATPNTTTSSSSMGTTPTSKSREHLTGSSCLAKKCSSDPCGLSSEPTATPASPPESNHSGDASDILTPVLVESQISRIKEEAFKLCRTLADPGPKPLSLRVPVNAEIIDVMNLPLDAVNRLELVRKYSAIYGRFDSRRKSDKPLTMHQLCVNEAAAWLCMKMASLLTRRDELFPLARLVVKESGYGYSTSCNGTTPVLNTKCPSGIPNVPIITDERELKKLRLDAVLRANGCSPDYMVTLKPDPSTPKRKEAIRESSLTPSDESPERPSERDLADLVKKEHHTAKELFENALYMEGLRVAHEMAARLTQTVE